jgi:hypothetical protein
MDSGAEMNQFQVSINGILKELDVIRQELGLNGIEDDAELLNAALSIGKLAHKHYPNISSALLIASIEVIQNGSEEG